MPAGALGWGGAVSGAWRVHFERERCSEGSGVQLELRCMRRDALLVLTVRAVTAVTAKLC